MTDRIGLCEALVDPPDATVDIIFVHGLNGGRLSAWTAENGDFWPTTFLPVDLPTARVFSFGYDATITSFWGDAFRTGIDDIADCLNNELSVIRSQTQTVARPIILIGYGHGGLVCKQVILSCQSKEDEDLKAVGLHIRRIAFFGTPHEIPDPASWADVPRFFSQLFAIANQNILKDLEHQSEKLSTLWRDFPQLLQSRDDTPEQVEIMSFFEGFDTQLKHHSFFSNPVFIVPEESACISGYPSRILNADHLRMCKFDDPNGASYKTVIRVLKRWTEALQTTRETRNIYVPSYGGMNSG